MPDLDALLTEADQFVATRGESRRDTDLVQRLASALRSVQVPVTEEMGWEYGVTRDPGSAYAEYTVGTEGVVREYAAKRPHLHACRRRKAGPWETLPTPGTTTEEE